MLKTSKRTHLTFREYSFLFQLQFARVEVNFTQNPSLPLDYLASSYQSWLCSWYNNYSFKSIFKHCSVDCEVHLKPIIRKVILKAMKNKWILQNGGRRGYTQELQIIILSGFSINSVEHWNNYKCALDKLKHKLVLMWLLLLP